QPANRVPYGNAAARFACEFGEGERARHFVGAVPVDPLEESVAPIVAPKLAIGDGLQAHPLLQCNRALDFLVFERAQRIGRALSFRDRLTHLEQHLGAQKTADVIGTERWIDSSPRCLSHALIPPCSPPAISV